MKKTLSVMSLLLLAGTAWAGGTSVKANAVAITDTCVGLFCDYYGGACVTNADCDPYGAISPKSKASITGAGQVKVQLKGVLDPAGTEATGNYYVYLLVAGQNTFPTVSIEVPVAGGKGKTEAALSTLLPPAGQSVTFLAYVLDPATMPAGCPSGNDPTNLIGRTIDAECDGSLFGYLGLVSAGKTKLKSNIAPIADACDMGACQFYGGLCAANADCDPAGSFSAKSKLQLSGDGKVKVQLKDVVDSAGMDATGNYHLDLNMSGLTGSVEVDIEIPVTDGKGKASVDLGALALMSPGGEVMSINYVYVRGPASAPALCPSGNDAVNLQGRSVDADCDGAIAGRFGVVSGS